MAKNSIDSVMTCHTCGCLMAIYDDGIACLESCEGVYLFQNLDLRKEAAEYHSIDDLRDVNGKHIKQMLRRIFPARIVEKPRGILPLQMQTTRAYHRKMAKLGYRKVDGGGFVPKSPEPEPVKRKTRKQKK